MDQKRKDEAKEQKEGMVYKIKDHGSKKDYGDKKQKSRKEDD